MGSSRRVLHEEANDVLTDLDAKVEELVPIVAPWVGALTDQIFRKLSPRLRIVGNVQC
jgi:hypothetical protein